MIITKSKRKYPKNFGCRDQGKLIPVVLCTWVHDLPTFVSHITKKNRFVIYMSLMHHNKAVDEVIRKPEVISYYNLTKGAVDALDKKSANFHIGSWLDDGLSVFLQNSGHKCS
jgi:hypothetical protein